MTLELATVPQMLAARGNKTIENLVAVSVGVGLLIVLAQIAVPLPWTPIPISGQTFGVALTALLWGRKRGMAIISSYLFLGAIGLPVFALGKSGISIGPTFGYLVGMFFATFAMGTLSDRVQRKTFFKVYAMAFTGSVITFSCGLLGLWFFVPTENLLTSGLIPFVPGDLIKTALASSIVLQSQKMKTGTNPTAV